MFTHIHPNTWTSYKVNIFETSSHSHLHCFFYKHQIVFTIYLIFLSTSSHSSDIVMILKPISELSFNLDKYCTPSDNNSDWTILILSWYYCFYSNDIDSELLRYCGFHYIVKELDSFINVDQIRGQTIFVVIRPMCALDPVIELGMYLARG